MTTTFAEPDRCIVAGCTEEPEHDTTMCRSHAAALRRIAASAAPPCGCTAEAACPQHQQAGQHRGFRSAKRGRS